MLSICMSFLCWHYHRVKIQKKYYNVLKYSPQVKYFVPTKAKDIF